MEITFQNFKHCDQIIIKGKVDSFTAPELTKAIEKMNDEGKFKLVLNMGELEYMSSAGFRALLIGQKNCKRFNRGEIILARIPKKIKDTLDLTGFTPLFRTFDDVTAAVGSF